MIGLVRPQLGRILAPAGNQDLKPSASAALPIAACAVLLSALATSAIGIQPIFGAFLNRGTGLATAQAFLDAGAKVAVTYRSGEPPPGSFAVPCDVTDPAAVSRAFDEVEAACGPVGVLVSNAGITRDALLLRMGEEDFAQVLETNWWAPTGWPSAPPIA
jgi:hypothetical protein